MTTPTSNLETLVEALKMAMYERQPARPVHKPDDLLSRALSIYWRAWQRYLNSSADEDPISAYYGYTPPPPPTPDEDYRIADRIEELTGLDFDSFVAELVKRVDRKWLYLHAGLSAPLTSAEMVDEFAVDAADCADACDCGGIFDPDSGVCPECGSCWVSPSDSTGCAERCECGGTFDPDSWVCPECGACWVTL